MVDRMVEALQVVHVQADFGREELRIEYRRLLARVAVQPADIAVVGERGDGVDFGAGLGRLERLGYHRRRRCRRRGRRPGRWLDGNQQCGPERGVLCRRSDRRCGFRLCRRFLHGRERRPSRGRGRDVHRQVMPSRFACDDLQPRRRRVRIAVGLYGDGPLAGRKIGKGIDPVAARHRGTDAAAVHTHGRHGRAGNGKLRRTGNDTNDRTGGCPDHLRWGFLGLDRRHEQRRGEHGCQNTLQVVLKRH